MKQAMTLLLPSKSAQNYDNDGIYSWSRIPAENIYQLAVSCQLQNHHYHCAVVLAPGDGCYGCCHCIICCCMSICCKLPLFCSSLAPAAASAIASLHSCHLLQYLWLTSPHLLLLPQPDQLQHKHILVTLQGLNLILHASKVAKLQQSRT
jgi:hypothetical protein